MPTSWLWCGFPVATRDANRSFFCASGGPGSVPAASKTILSQLVAEAGATVLFAEVVSCSWNSRWSIGCNHLAWNILQTVMGNRKLVGYFDPIEERVDEQTGFYQLFPFVASVREDNKGW
jgi:hypothetical protein